MKRFIKTALTVVLAAAAVSCAKEVTPQKENINGTIDLTITGTINGYTPQEETKAEAQTVVRIMWKGDETVYVFDGTECLGSLTASIEGKDSTYAKLSGTIIETEATTLTFVYSPQFDAEPDVTEGGKISLDLSVQKDKEVPFLIYATLPTAQAPTSFTNEVVQFNLATSVFKCNCAGLGGDGEISQAAINGVNTKCELTLSASGAPEVSGTTPGTITRTDGFTKADQRAIFSVALPKTAATEADRTIEVTKGVRTFTASYPKNAFDVSKSYNSVFALEAVPYSAIPFTITSTGNTTVAIEKEGEPYDISLEYKKGSDDWSDYTIGSEIDLADGESLQFRAGEGGNDGFSKVLGEDSYHITVDGDGTVSASGNIMSLVDSTLERTNLNEYIFAGLFVECENLTDASNLVLPATTLAAGCYAGMFAFSGLTDAPALPATELAEGCYLQMFGYCASLTDAPALPAETLAEYCYTYMFMGSGLKTAPALSATTLAEESCSYMFANCTNLTTAPALPATTLAKSCYESMFYGCTNLTAAPLLPAKTLAVSCYSAMFLGCTSLTVYPALPATTLAERCYLSMFKGCTKLTHAPALPAETLAESCYSEMFMESGLTAAPALPATALAKGCYCDMFNGCTNLTTAPALPATELAEGCYSHMFQDCSSLTEAPILPAITLKKDCYYQMFSGCGNLNYVKAFFTTIPGYDYTDDWLKEVASTGTFVMNSSATWWNIGNDGIPEGWTVEKLGSTETDPEETVL